MPVERGIRSGQRKRLRRTHWLPERTTRNNLLYATTRRKNLGRARPVPEVPATGRLPGRRNIRRVGRSVAEKKHEAGRSGRSACSLQTSWPRCGRPAFSPHMFRPHKWPPRILTSNVFAAEWPMCITTPDVLPAEWPIAILAADVLAAEWPSDILTQRFKPRSGRFAFSPGVSLEKMLELPIL